MVILAPQSVEKIVDVVQLTSRNLPHHTVVQSVGVLVPKNRERSSRQAQSPVVVSSTMTLSSSCRRQ